MNRWKAIPDATHAPLDSSIWLTYREFGYCGRFPVVHDNLEFEISNPVHFYLEFFANQEIGNKREWETFNTLGPSELWLTVNDRLITPSKHRNSVFCSCDEFLFRKTLNECNPDSFHLKCIEHRINRDHRQRLQCVNCARLPAIVDSIVFASALMLISIILFGRIFHSECFEGYFRKCHLNKVFAKRFFQCSPISICMPFGRTFTFGVRMSVGANSNRSLQCVSLHLVQCAQTIWIAQSTKKPFLYSNESGKRPNTLHVSKIQFEYGYLRRVCASASTVLPARTASGGSH